MRKKKTVNDDNTEEIAEGIKTLKNIIIQEHMEAEGKNKSCYRVELEKVQRYNIQLDTQQTTHFMLYILYCILYLTFYFQIFNFNISVLINRLITT
jgi:hypothetical protein